MTELHKKLLSMLVLAMMALSMAVASGCSSSEEAPPAEESSSGDCEDQCGGDPDCIEKCIQDLPI